MDPLGDQIVFDGAGEALIERFLLSEFESLMLQKFLLGFHLYFPLLLFLNKLSLQLASNLAVLPPFFLFS